MDSENPQGFTSLAPVDHDSLSTGRGYNYSFNGLPNYLPAQDNGLLQYWPVLRKHRWTIFATIIVVVTMATIVTVRTTPIYEAVGRIAIGHENNDVLGFKNAAEGFNSEDDYDYTVALDTQVKILQSDAIALATARALQLDKTPAFSSSNKESEALAAPSVDPRQEAALMGFIQGGLKLTVVPKTRIIEIRFANPDGEMAAKVVNTL